MAEWINVHRKTRTICVVLVSFMIHRLVDKIVSILIFKKFLLDEFAILKVRTVLLQQYQCISESVSNACCNE